MSRCASTLLGPPTHRRFVTAVQIRLLSRGLGSVHEEDRKVDYAAARKWAADLSKNTIPRNIARVRFDRSSGKGGQHVNT